MKNECYKESYETERQARRAALGINKRKKGGRIRVYKCSDCGKYHLTSKKQF